VYHGSGNSGGCTVIPAVLAPENQLLSCVERCVLFIFVQTHGKQSTFGIRLLRGTVSRRYAKVVRVLQYAPWEVALTCVPIEQRGIADRQGGTHRDPKERQIVQDNQLLGKVAAKRSKLSLLLHSDQVLWPFSFFRWSSHG
jgi:hypothetical protein